MKTRIDVSRIYVLLSFLISFFIYQVNYAGMASGKLVGRVTNAATKEPLIGATVQIVGREQGAVTDLEGDYLILNLSPGRYSVKVSVVGFKSMIKTEIDISINHTTTVNFQLEETVVQFDQSIVVTAERPLVEKDLTSTRHFVSASEISARPTTQLTHILASLPGIDVNSAGELTVRRGSLDQVAFMIDGIRARNPLDSQPYTNINLSAIQELEIITGGFNAEYGEAQSGVFNIITKDGSDNFEGFAEFRYTPPGLKHWGTALYDYATPRFWENSNARHLQWWIDNPNMWIDPNGVHGNNPSCIWTPEQAYQDYMNTHQPLTDYTELSTYQTEFSLGGPTPLTDLFFFFSGKYRTAPPISGNSYLRRGNWSDGTLKLTYKFTPTIKLLASGFYSTSETSYGMESFTFENGFENKYAYYDYPGFPKNRVDGQTIKFTHVLDQFTFYEVQFSRVFRYRSQSTFPNDETGWETGAPIYNRLRAVDANGYPIPGGYSNIIGRHTTGYYYRGEDRNTDLSLSGDLVSQIQKTWQIKTGFGFTYYLLDRFQEAKAYNVIEDEVYKPYEGDIYVQNKLEFEGLIMNLGLRLDFYNANDYVYKNIYDPFDLINSKLEKRAPKPITEPTKLHGQLSPRIGISHPISEQTVLHFSYGHFFQRAPFGDYGEGTGNNASGQRVTGILNTYLMQNSDGTETPYNLGNRLLKPQKTVQYEIGVEHNLGGMVTTVTAFYKDYSNTIRTVRVFMDDGTSYLTTGNSNYQDAKGIEVAIRKPLSGFWGGYLNFSWSTGISGRSGDPDVIASPASGIQNRLTGYTGDDIIYDPSRLKLGLTFLIPKDFSLLFGIFANMQIAMDYSVYYPHEQIISDNFGEGGKSYLRFPYKNALVRIRKEFSLGGFNLAGFIEIQNAFNDKHLNLQVVNSTTATLQQKVDYINSGFSVYPEYTPTGGAFPDVMKNYNLPRSIVFGFAVGF